MSRLYPSLVGELLKYRAGQRGTPGTGQLRPVGKHLWLTAVEPAGQGGAKCARREVGHAVKAYRGAGETSSPPG